MTSRLARLLVFFVVATALLVMPTSTLAQQARDAATSMRGAATITGRVVSDDGGRPVGHALVTVTGIAPAFAEVASTDADGRFVFTGLPAGDVTVTATKTTYLTAYLGAHDPIRGPAVPVRTTSASPLDVTLRLVRGAVIAGVVTGSTGRPQAGAEVTANLSRLAGSARRLVGGPRGHGGVTDDKGRYRIWGLAPGEYVVRATPNAAESSARVTSDADVQWASAIAGGARAGAAPGSATREVRFATVYYPGATDPSQASVVTIGAGEERDGLDVPLRSIATADIRGTVTGVDGQAAVQVTVALDGALEHFTTLSDSAGHFAFRSVAPGNFTLSARGSGRPQTSPDASAEESFWGAIEISVNGEPMTDVALTLQQGMAASGRVAFEGSSQVRPSQAVVTVTPVDDRSGTAHASQAHAAADGTFAFKELAPGHYRFRAAYTGAPGASGASGSWLVKSVLWRGQDLLDATLDVAPGQDVSGLTVVFSDRQTDLRGTFFDSAEHPVAGYDVIVFAADRRFWTPESRRIERVTLGRDGRFDFDSLPAGDYLLAAVTHADADDLSDPDWLDSVAPLALHVTLADGEHKIQDIRLGR